MSKIALTPNATGTGVFSILSPATNTDRSLTLPDEAGTVLTGSGPINVNASAPNQAVTVDASGNVGIGTSSPDVFSRSYTGTTTGISSASGETALMINSSGTNVTALEMGRAGTRELMLYDTSTTSQLYTLVSKPFIFGTDSTERMRIDSSGNVLVGTTDTVPSNNGAGGDAGVAISPDGVFRAARSGNVSLDINRMDSDGDIAAFRKDGTTVGSIGSQGTSLYIQADGDRAGLTFGGADVVPRKNNANSDNAVDLGHPSYRYKVVYAGTGSINTSDRNEKQDIDVMSEAETRVAVACKGLMRKFRFIDAVEAKGDDARIHFGIIAQDLQDAFAAEGLDASRYAMFCSNTWWEADRVVPAVEAVDATLDDEGNQITEAVVAVAEHTVTDKFMTLEKAPEGATERTRLGVRYPELLAFIIGAL